MRVAGVGTLVRCDICSGEGNLSMPGSDSIVIECPDCGGSGQRRKAGRPPQLV